MVEKKRKAPRSEAQRQVAHSGKVEPNARVADQPSQIPQGDTLVGQRHVAEQDPADKR